MLAKLSPTDHSSGQGGGPQRLRIGDIPAKFNHNPARILEALAESQQAGLGEEEVTIILSLQEVRNLIFPPFEGEARWRFCYARAKVSRSAARLTSQIYFSSAIERFGDLVLKHKVICSNATALRREIGARTFDRLAPHTFDMQDGVATTIALRSFLDQAYAAGDFLLRPTRDWAQFALDTIVQFYPAAATEARLQRYPWESITPEDSPFLAEVRGKAALVGHDPATALLSALAQN